jgi:hypothetical protein
MNRLALVAVLALSLSACATHYLPTNPGPGPFTFTLTPEQCAQLQKERRTYRATEKTAGYVSGASAVLTGIFLAFLEAKAAPAASASVTLAASSVSVFARSQVTDLDDELTSGQCSRCVPLRSRPPDLDRRRPVRGRYEDASSLAADRDLCWSRV